VASEWILRSRASRRVRVLIVEPAGLLGGSERALLDLISHLHADRFDVAVACPSNARIQVELDRLGIRTVHVPIALLHQRGLLARLWALVAMAALMIRLRPDVVHLNQAGMLRLVSLASRISGASILCHVRLLEDARRIGQRPSSAPRSARFVVVSRAVLVELLRSGMIEASRVERVYDPFDQSKFRRDAAKVSPSLVRNTLGIPECATVVAMVGRVCEDKKQELLIEAIAQSSRRDIYCLVVGGDPPSSGNEASYRERLLNRLRTDGLSQRIVFTGMREDVPALMMASDIVVMASEEEALGRVLLEALSLGKHAVAPNGGGPSEIIGDDERGLGFTPGDVAGLTHCIESTLNDAESAKRRTAIGAEWVATMCSPTTHAREIERIYSDLGHQAIAR